jgi:hypothetical protein
MRNSARLLLAVLVLAGGCRIVDRREPVFDRDVSPNGDLVLLQTGLGIDVVSIEWLWPLKSMNPAEKPGPWIREQSGDIHRVKITEETIAGPERDER